MFTFRRLLKHTWPVVLTAGLAANVVASEFVRAPAASPVAAMSPAELWAKRSTGGGIPGAARWLRMPPPAMRTVAGSPYRAHSLRAPGVPVWRMPPPPPYWVRPHRQAPAAARYQRPLPAVATPQPSYANTARLAHYRPPMPPPAPYWARTPRQAASLARYQRPLPPATAPQPAPDNTARLAQYRPPMPPPAPYWARTPRQAASLARYQRPLPPAAAPQLAARLAQYRPPMPPPAPEWVRAQRPPVNLARYQRPLPPAAAPQPAARLAQYRPPMLSPTPWASTRRSATTLASSVADSSRPGEQIDAGSVDEKEPSQLTASASPATETAQPPVHGAESTSGTAAEMAELAAFESSPADTAAQSPVLIVESDDITSSEETAELTVTAPSPAESQQLHNEPSAAETTIETKETAGPPESITEAEATAEAEQLSEESS